MFSRARSPPNYAADVPDLLVAAVAVGILLSLYRLSHRRNRARRSAAATTSVVVDVGGVERRLADGRVEGARWARLDHVEVVCTPVPTADGTKVFVLLAEQIDPDDPRGCLVPLGVGYDEALLVELTRLPRFDVAAWGAAQGHRPPKRTIVWRSAQGPGVPGTGGGTGSGGTADGTGNA